MTLKDLLYSNEDINDKLDHCQSKDCCKHKMFRLGNSGKRDKFKQHNDVFCHNKIKRGPYVILKDFSYNPPLLIFKKNNKLHSTVGPALLQNTLKMYFLYGIHVPELVHVKYNKDKFKIDFFNKVRVLFIMLFYYAGFLFWKENSLYALAYVMLYLFWIGGIFFIYNIVFDSKPDLIFLAACVLFTVQTFKIIKSTIKSFENV